MIRTAWLCVVLWLAGPAATVAAAEAGEPLCPTRSHQPLPVVSGDADDPRTHLQADKADVGSDRITTFRGDVVIRRGINQLQADEARYDHQTDNIHATGNVQLLQENLLLRGEQADINLAEQSGEISQATYRTGDNKQGQASRISFAGQQRLELVDATYTTCDQADPDWVLSAGQIMLNNQTRQGTAEDVVVRFKGVPFLYLPYMRFPIGDERLTGLLYPSVGNSDKHGSQLIMPFYWNIAPQYDATITANYMSERGTMLENEFRYLAEGGQGQLDVHYLGDDKKFGADRDRVRWQHYGSAGLGWRSEVDYNYVGDTFHLEDFGDSLNAASTTYLDRKGSLSYNAASWQFTTTAQSFQTLSGTEAYQRLPQVTFNTRLQQDDNRLNYHFDSEWVKFVHRDNSRIAGTRLDLRPALSLPLQNSAGFFIPRLEARYTQYELVPTSTSGEPELTRSLPLFSIDSGLFFERDTTLFGNDLLQTLEPQLFYVYIPYREQDALPVFDASDPGFSINDPFRVNRFDGADRVGDTNHITAALTTRLLSQASGSELLMARIAQIFYFDDRRVTLPGGSPQTAQRSDIIAQLTAQPSSHWYLHTDLTWSPYTEKINTGNARLRYQQLERFSLELAYRYERDVLETNEVGFGWRLNPRWQFTGRKQYDLLEQRDLETAVGLRYDSCCWGLNLQAREYFIREGQDNDRSIMLELELKGLASFGNL